MIFVPRITSALILAAVMGMIAVTNLWPSFEYGYLVLGQTDTESYRAIAQAAPGVALQPLPYHHAQRFWIYWLIGEIAHTSGLSLDQLCRLLIIILLF